MSVETASDSGTQLFNSLLNEYLELLKREAAIKQSMQASESRVRLEC